MIICSFNSSSSLSTAGGGVLTGVGVGGGVGVFGGDGAATLGFSVLPPKADTTKFFIWDNGIKNPIVFSLGTSVSLLTWISNSPKALFSFSCNATSNWDLVSGDISPVLGSN